MKMTRWSQRYAEEPMARWLERYAEAVVGR